MRTLLGAVTALTLTLIPLSTTALSTTASTAASASDGAPGDPRPAGLSWKRVGIDTDQGLRGLDAVSDKIAWVTGSGGGVWRTVNGGRSWKNVSPDVPPVEGEPLMYRDVEATSDKTALILAIGPGAASQVLRTSNGGKSWKRTFLNEEPAAFYDCMAMYPDGRHGLALSDPVDGQMRLIRTKDGGRTWKRVAQKGLPAPVEGEFYFAASGTCLITSGDRDAWIVSGGGAARVLHSTDRGRTWDVAETTLAPGAAAGAFSIAVRGDQGVIVGGDFEQETDGVDRSAYLTKSGRWLNGGDLGGYRSGVTWLPGTKRTAVAVGPSGSDVTVDGGRSWTTFSDADLDSVQCGELGKADKTCWGSGAEGAVVRLRIKR